jgi:hypothetical protein
MASETEEPSARGRIDAALGFLYAYHGRNIAYARVFEYWVDLANDTVTVLGESIENPMALGIPRVAPAAIGTCNRLAQALRDLPEAIGSRIETSLRWFTTATAHSGPDAFLSYWIALETLAMQNTTDIRPLNEARSLLRCIAGAAWGPHRKARRGAS